jgi:hypothetical protein
LERDTGGYKKDCREMRAVFEICYNARRVPSVHTNHGNVAHEENDCGLNCKCTYFKIRIQAHIGLHVFSNKIHLGKSIEDKDDGRSNERVVKDTSILWKKNFDGTDMIQDYEKRKGEHHSKKMVDPGYDFADWSLNKVIVATIKAQFGEPLIDLFATERNTKAEYYFQRVQIRKESGRNCLGSNAYNFNWNRFKGMLCWMNPPFDQIMNAVDKAIGDNIGRFILITPYTNRRIEYLAGGEKPHLITHTKDVFIPVSKQGSKVEKGVGMPHWKGNHSFAYLCDTQGKEDALNFNGKML